VVKCLQVGLRRIEFEDMQERQKGIESSVVVYVNSAKWINIDARILIHFSMILTCYIIDDFFLIEASGQERVIENKQVSYYLLVDDQKRLDFAPTVQHKFVPILE
jgi:hypothetical protein